MIYREFKIEVEKMGGGYSMFCYRLYDGFVLADSWNYYIKTKKYAINECKIIIDDFIENPSDYHV